MRRAFFLGLAAAGLGAVATGAGAGCNSVPDYPLLVDMCPDDGGVSVCLPSTGATTQLAGSGPSGAGGASASSASASSASSSGASTSSGSGAGAGGATTTSDLTGTVHRITSPDFSDGGQVVSTAATIAIYPSSGPQVNVPYGGSAGTTFDAMGLAPGKAWLVVQDGSNGAAGIWSTVSSVTLPQISSVALPVIDQAMFASIGATLPTVSAKGISSTAAHVVILAQHAGAPYTGLEVSGATGGALVAYDTGPGAYSDSATATGTAGVVLLFDSSLSGMASISLNDPTLKLTFSVPILAGAGVVSVVTADL